MCAAQSFCEDQVVLIKWGWVQTHQPQIWPVFTQPPALLLWLPRSVVTRFRDMCGYGHDFTSCQLFCGPWREEGVVSVCVWGPATCQIGWLDQFCSFIFSAFTNFNFPSYKGRAENVSVLNLSLGVITWLRSPWRGQPRDDPDSLQRENGSGRSRSCCEI